MFHDLQHDYAFLTGLFEDEFSWVVNRVVIFKAKTAPRLFLFCSWQTAVYVFISKYVYSSFSFFSFYIFFRGLPFTSCRSGAGGMLVLESFHTFLWINDSSQVQRNNIYWIDVSQSYTLSKYICIHWAALLNHTALAARPQDSQHPDGNVGRLCKASCWLLKRLYLCISYWHSPRTDFK